MLYDLLEKVKVLVQPVCPRKRKSFFLLQYWRVNYDWIRILLLEDNMQVFSVLKC
jgi:hypothetical protein